MPENSLTDFAARQFAGEEPYLPEDSDRERRSVVNNALLGILGSAGAEDFPDELAAYAPARSRAATIDQGLAARQAIARA
jgi:hypothetical protein